MKQFGDLYSQYYDLLYSDKEYDKEVEYIDNLIQQNTNTAKSILDMGCGTGKHAQLLCDKGYKVHGIDLSKDMLKIANKRRKGKKKQLRFTHSNIQELNLKKKFDVVVSLFHVMSYQNTNEELLKAFQVAKKHLKKDGIFIFDFWYGPAVLTDLPVTRVKRLEDKKIKVTRVAEPTLNVMTNVVDVNYDIFIENRKSKNIITKKELHKMRYFFDTELKVLCESIGFSIVKRYKWMSCEKPDFGSWNVVWVLKT